LRICLLRKMKNILELELFGDNIRQQWSIYRGISEMIAPGMFDKTIGKMPSNTWVAEITGFDEKYKFARAFLHGKKDYSRANSNGSRGVYLEYVLESGKVYEVKSQETWSRVRRYFCRIDEQGRIISMTEEEVIEWLKSH
jgi:hypothetical protein